MRARKARLEAAYKRLRPTIFSVVYSFQGKFGGDTEELISEAHEHFIFIFDTHDEKRQTLERDVVFRLFKRLMATRVKESRRKRILNAVPAEGDDERLGRERLYFSVGEFVEDFSEEAREVVRLAFNPPPDVELAYVERGGGLTDPEFRRNFRNALKEYLTDCQWTVKQIRQSFGEIRTALTGRQ